MLTIRNCFREEKGRKGMKKHVWAIIVLLLITIGCAAEAGTLHLPWGLETVEEDAFFGDPAISSLTVPEGTRFIYARAFAYSGLREVQLPASLRYIADNAFEGCSQVSVTAIRGTYAYSWALRKGFIPQPAIQNISAKIDSTGTAVITWTDEENAPEYAIYEILDGYEQLVGTTKGHTWKLPEITAGTHQYTIYARENSGVKRIVGGSSDVATLTVAAWETPYGITDCKAEKAGTVTLSIQTNGTATKYGVWEILASGERRSVTTGELSGDNTTVEITSVTPGDHRYVVRPMSGSTAGIASEPASVTVYDSDPVTSISLSSSSKATMTVGEIRTLSWTAYSAPGTSADKTITWSVDNPEIATVNGKQLTALQEGHFTLIGTPVRGTPLEVTMWVGATYTVNKGEWIGANLQKAASKTDLIVPADLGITKIGYQALSNYKNNIRTIILPEGTEEIGYQAFKGFTSLTSITIPGSVVRIGEYAFSGCTALQQIVLPNGIIRIDNYAFNGCTQLAEINFPETLQGIGLRAFAGCTALAHVEIGGPNMAIGDYAFNGCTSLESLVIREGSSAIGASACASLTNLRSVTMPEDMDSIGASAFSGCTALQTVVMPERLARLGDRAFYQCSSLTAVTIPEGLSAIPSQAFEMCSSLENVTLPEGIRTIKYRAFGSCNAMSTIDLPESCTAIETYAFCHTGLTEIHLPGKLESIGDCAFSSCASLTRVVIPNTVREIGGLAFGNTALSQLTLPQGLISLGERVCTDRIVSVDFNHCHAVLNDKAFYGARTLTSISHTENIVSCGSQAFENTALAGTVSLENCTTLGKRAFYGTDITSISISGQGTAIGDYAFANCSELQSVTLTGHFRSLGEYLFNNCSALTNLTFPETCASIGRFLCQGCATLLGPITLPAGIHTIPYGCFSGCKALTGVTVPSGVNAIAQSAFSSTEALSSIHLPETLTSIGEDAFIFSGIPQIQIPDSVRAIERRAFYGCARLASARLPAQIDRIGESAFYNCKALRNVTWPQHVGEIGASAFEKAALEGNANLTGAMWIGDKAFYQQTNLQQVQLSSELRHVGNYAFYGCEGLTEMNLPAGVTWIGSAAFDGCMSLNSIWNLHQLETLGDQAFAHCSAHISVTVPRTLTKIRDNMFAHSGARLDSENYVYIHITIPDTITEIGKYAFYGCVTDSIVLPASVETVGEGGLATSTIERVEVRNGNLRLTLYTFGSGSIGFPIPQIIAAPYNSQALADAQELQKGTNRTAVGIIVSSGSTSSPIGTSGQVIIGKGQAMSLTDISTGLDSAETITFSPGQIALTMDGNLYGTSIGETVMSWTKDGITHSRQIQVIGYKDTTAYALNCYETIEIEDFVCPPTIWPVSWSTGDESIASAGADGKITGLKTGITTVRITFSNGAYSESSIRVLNGPVTEFSLEEDVTLVGTNETVQLTPVLLSGEVSPEFTYHTEDPTIANVDGQSGRVTGIRAGKTRVRVTARSGAEATALIWVLQPGYTRAEAKAQLIANLNAMRENYGLLDKAYLMFNEGYMGKDKDGNDVLFKFDITELTNDVANNLYAHCFGSQAWKYDSQLTRCAFIAESILANAPKDKTCPTVSMEKIKRFNEVMGFPKAFVNGLEYIVHANDFRTAEGTVAAYERVRKAMPSYFETVPIPEAVRNVLAHSDEISAGIWAAEQAAASIRKYIDYSNIDRDWLLEVIQGLRRSNNEDLLMVAGILEAMLTDDGMMYYIAATMGFETAQKVGTTILKGALKDLSAAVYEIPVIGQLYAGAQIGIAIGTTFNDAILNISALETAEFKTLYAINAARNYRQSFVQAYDAFLADPYDEENYQKVREATRTYSELIALQYENWGEIPRALDSSAPGLIRKILSELNLSDEESYLVSADSAGSYAKLIREVMLVRAVDVVYTDTGLYP